MNGDESSDSDSEPEAKEADDEPEAEDADVELESEDPDSVPKATIGTGSQRPFVVRGLVPWALRRDLKALHRHERIREAESETSRTEVVERLKVLESEENTTLRKKLAEKEVLLDLTRMERDRAEKRLSESIWWNNTFELIQHKADEATEGEKRKGESDRGGRGDNRREHNRRQNQRRGNAGAMTNVAPNNNETCQKCKNKRHAGDCWKVTERGIALSWVEIDKEEIIAENLEVLMSLSGWIGYRKMMPPSYVARKRPITPPDEEVMAVLRTKVRTGPLFRKR
nr:hypothetical protein [Tanacetum cinerariifolium]